MTEAPSRTSIKLHGGVFFDFLKPEECDVTIEQVAHHLSMQNRYCGALRVPFSVAQHSVLVANIASYLSREAGLERMDHIRMEFDALMHDTPEFVMGDMVHPLKILCPDFKAHEDRLDKVFATKFGYRLPFDPIIKRADLIARYVETYNFDPEFDGENTTVALGEEIPEPYLKYVLTEKNWREARADFIERYLWLTYFLKD